MPTAARSAEGAILGFAQGSTTNYEEFRRQNKSVLESALMAPVETVKNPDAVVTGAALGAVGGLISKRLRALSDGADAPVTPVKTAAEALPVETLPFRMPGVGAVERIPRSPIVRSDAGVAAATAAGLR